ncbi:hypothetical protein BD560DRAFT_494467 [Blakeslea trispora]|nr:hypothetical protein BD560DRAFT_494467 [Blakeslea trispora]
MIESQGIPLKLNELANTVNKLEQDGSSLREEMTLLQNDILKSKHEEHIDMACYGMDVSSNLSLLALDPSIEHPFVESHMQYRAEAKLRLICILRLLNKSSGLFSTCGAVIMITMNDTDTVSILSELGNGAVHTDGCQSPAGLSMNQYYVVSFLRFSICFSYKSISTQWLVLIIIQLFCLSFIILPLPFPVVCLFLLVDTKAEVSTKQISDNRVSQQNRQKRKDFNSDNLAKALADALDILACDIEANECCYVQPTLPLKKLTRITELFKVEAWVKSVIERQCDVFAKAIVMIRTFAYGNGQIKLIVPKHDYYKRQYRDQLPYPHRQVLSTMVNLVG